MMPSPLPDHAQRRLEIGEPLQPGDLARPPQEDCPCKEGMFPRAGRRGFLGGTSLLVGAAASLVLPAQRASAQEAKAPPGAALWPVAEPPWSQPGRVAGADGGYGLRSQFETVVRVAEPTGTASRTPLQATEGIITPSGLHYERHHNGIPTIDPAQHRLIIHGMVEQPMKYSVADLRRFPRMSRVMFLECSGNSGADAHRAATRTAQTAHGLTSTSEWTGVKLSTLLEQVGLKPGASWILAEGADAAMMTRSVPIEKCMTDAFIAFAQNGEAIRPENGYPMRLMLPGYEGNINIKWLRRLEVSDKPFMTREETSKYTDLITLTGKARQFSLVMEAKSVITFPSGDMKLPGPGFYEVTGLAWTGRGAISRVEISTDGGRTWSLAALQEPILPMAHTRFRFPWSWNGQEAVLQSRAIDETGYVQPTKQFLERTEGVGPTYHYNGIQSWKVAADGSVTNVYA